MDATEPTVRLVKFIKPDQQGQSVRWPGFSTTVSRRGSDVRVEFSAVGTVAAAILEAVENSLSSGD